MPNVKIYPSGPFANTTANRAQAVEVDADRLALTYPAGAFSVAGELDATSWPADGTATHMESDVPGYELDAIIWEPFPTVRAKLGLGDAAAKIAGGSILGIVAVVGLGWWLLRGRK